MQKWLDEGAYLRRERMLPGFTHMGETIAMGPLPRASQTVAPSKAVQLGDEGARTSLKQT